MPRRRCGASRSGCAGALELSAIPAAIVAAGAAVEVFGAAPVLFTLAVALGAITLLAAGLPGLRQLDAGRSSHHPSPAVTR